MLIIDYLWSEVPVLLYSISALGMPLVKPNCLVGTNCCIIVYLSGIYVQMFADVLDVNRRGWGDVHTLWHTWLDKDLTTWSQEHFIKTVNTVCQQMFAFCFCLCFIQHPKVFWIWSSIFFTDGSKNWQRNSQLFSLLVDQLNVVFALNVKHKKKSSRWSHTIFCSTSSTVIQFKFKTNSIPHNW